MASDPIDFAIAAAKSKEQAAEPDQTMYQLTIDSTQRMVAFGCPNDLTDAELVEVIGWMTTVLRPKLTRGPKLVMAASLAGLKQ